MNRGEVGHCPVSEPSPSSLCKHSTGGPGYRLVSKDNKNYPLLSRTASLRATSTRRLRPSPLLSSCLFIHTHDTPFSLATTTDRKEDQTTKQSKQRASVSITGMGEQDTSGSEGGGNVVEAQAPAPSKKNGDGRAADPRLQGISDAIRVVPHFPKPGIMFNDITALLLRPGVFKDAVDMFVERYRGMGIAAVAGIEARGFIFGPAIALAIGAKFIPLRKPGKLPGEVISETYTLEYGTDCLEMHVGAVEPGDRVVVVDDLVATGGTLSAAIKLLERAAADVVECACLIGLPKFKDLYKLDGKPVYILVESRK